MKSQLQALLISTLDGGEWSDSFLQLLCPCVQKDPCAQRGLNGPNSRSALRKEEGKNLSLPEFEYRSEYSWPEQFEDPSEPNSKVNLGSYQSLVLT
jgi:hypothetical protein